jgi:hypothetical protein
MNCAEVEQRLSAYYDGELPGEARQAVDQHLAACESCARQLDRFRELSSLAQSLTEPAAPKGQWPELERKLDEQQSAAPARVSVVPTWWRRPRVALVAAAIVVALGLGWWAYNAWRPPHDHLAVDFAAYLDEFQRNPRDAQRALLTRYEGRAVELQQAAAQLGYVPAVAHGLPDEYTVSEVYVWNMPCCKCAQSLCKREDGTTIAIFEHDEEQPTWFGDRPSIEGKCHGRPCSIYQIDGQLAASWKRDGRHLTAVGLRDLQEISDLIARLNQRAALPPT